MNAFVPRYLARLGHRGPVAPTLEVLTALHRAHLFQVPFENLDVLEGRPLSLAPDALFTKIVKERRGGICYELNVSFGELLRRIGFQVSYLACRVTTVSLSPPFAHLALRVELDEGPWLADVGFGTSIRAPMRLAAGITRVDGHSLKLERGPQGWLLTSRFGRAQWKGEYAFQLRSYPLKAFAPMLHFHQTSPRAPFTNRLFAARLTPEGWVRYDGHTVDEGRFRTVWRKHTDHTRAGALARWFGLVPRR